MGFLAVFVRRPVFTTMLLVSLVVLGLASFTQLGVDIFPKVDLPTITITTRLPGASPEEVESQITKVIEEAVNTIAGLDELRSSSIEGQSQVFATFVLERNVQEAANDVREKVSAVLSRFPAGTEAPVIEKADPDSAPILRVVVSGQRSAREITEIADKRIKRQLETVKDVGAITMVGGRKREVQVFVDPDRLTAYGLSIQQVRDALVRQNVEIPGGRLTGGAREEGVRTLGRIETIDGFGDLIVTDRKDGPVRIRDIATVVDGEEEPRTLSRLNGKNAVSLVIRKQSGTNTVAVVDRLKVKLAEIQKGLPQDIRFEIAQDLSRFIKRAIHEVQDHLLLGGLLASLIVAVFIGNLVWWEMAAVGLIVAAVGGAFVSGNPDRLMQVTMAAIAVTLLFFASVRKLRPAFVAALAIPCSIIATFTAMRVAGFTLNNLTMLGLSLSTGIVIDDAIIVLENIYRHIEEEGHTPFEAAISGTREIALAVLATTLSLVVIFLPVAFMGGLVGKFWNSFGLTTTFAIMVSLLVAFTLAPMLGARIFHAGASGPGAGSKGGRLYHAIETGYERLLAWSLRRRWVIVLVCLAIFAGGWYLLKHSRLEFVVSDDMSEFEVVAEAPPGSSLERTAGIIAQMEQEIRKLPEVVTLFSTAGVRGQAQSNVTDISIYVGLKHITERTRTQDELKQEVRRLLAGFPGMRVSVQHIPLIGGGGFRQTEFNLILRGPDIARLEAHAQGVIKELATRPGWVDLDTALAYRQPEVQVRIDRQKAADLGVRVDAVASTLRTSVGGEKVGFYRELGEQYDVRLRLREDFRATAGTLPNLYVPAGDGRLVRLANVATLDTGMSPGQIERYAQERAVTIISNLYQKPLAEAYQEAYAAVRRQPMGPEYGIVTTGRGKLLQESLQNFLIALVLSLAFIYIVLAAQFESFVHPITIMASMFLAVPFGLLTLAVLYRLGVPTASLNIYSIMGLFLLMGVVKKNAILQVDYTNVLRGRGLGRLEAQMQADRVRLRPILMTTLAIIAGMLPVALGRGDGSASRASLATVVVGGQALALIVTLVVTPVIYSMFDDLRGLPAFSRVRFPRWRPAWASRAWGPGVQTDIMGGPDMAPQPPHRSPGPG
ncbi:MAG: efflux RND transporter permease subunit [Candidatus Rokubacteria bacterium]|nr:efflux RND transporter permease subunit [Candidatus Rokubacteria bacterium]